MEVKFDIPDLLYRNLEAYCNTNNVAVADVLYDVVSDWLYTKIYGDINPIKDEKTVKPDVEMSKVESVVEKTETVVETPIETVVAVEKKTADTKPIGNEQTTVVKKPRRRKLPVN